MRVTAVALLVAVTGCLNPSPHALIQLDDPEGLAGSATAIAIGTDAGVFRRLDSIGTFPVSFTVTWPREDAEEVLIFEALDSNDVPLARTRARVRFPVGTVPNFNLSLAAACEQSDSVGQVCVLPDAESEGTCVAGSCVPTDCGDGKVDDGEECDDGNRLTDDDCTTECRFNVCGDGFFNPNVEPCDDGNDDNTDDCVIVALGTENQCQSATCGDGFVRAGVEECDPAAENAPPDCLDTCRLNFCGDRFVLAGTEQCDDGNDNPNDGCDACSIVTWTPALRFTDAPLSGTGTLVNAIDMAWVAPGGLAVLVDGGDQLVYVDIESGRVRPLTRGGGGGGSSTGDGALAAQSTLSGAEAVAAFGDGALALADTDSHRVRLIDPATGSIDTLLGIGRAGAFGGADGANIMDTPRGVAFDRDGSVVFNDSGNLRVRSIDLRTGLVENLDSLSQGAGALDVVVASSGALIVADPPATVLSLAADSTDEEMNTLPLNGGDTLVDLAIDSDGRAYAASGDTLWRFDPADVSGTQVRLAGVTGDASVPDGTAALSATLNDLQSVAVASDGSIFLLESGSGHIRGIDENGDLTTVLPRDGTLDATSLDEPVDVLAFANDDWLVLERGALRRVNVSGVETVLGRSGGSPIGTTPVAVSAAAILNGASSIARDGAALYIAEDGAGRILRINLVDPADVGSWTVEELLTGFTAPSGLGAGPAPDGSPALVVSDAETQTLTRLDLIGLSTTVIVGPGSFTDVSSDQLERLNSPGDLAVAEDGTVYVADRLNNKIRRVRCFVDRPCEIATVMGDAVLGRLTSAGRADSARLEGPASLALDSQGNLLVVSARDAALLVADGSGIVGPESQVISLFASSPELAADCLRGGAIDAAGAVALVDPCRGAFIDIQRSSQ